MNKIELQQRMRFQPTGMQVRENTEGEESRIIEGCAIVFNRETTLWDGKYTRLREVIAPSCVTEEFLREQDIKLNLLHDRSMSLARNNKGEGTLTLDLREDGLYFSAEMPKCDLGDQVLALVRNKTYTGCSFEFFAKDYTEECTVLEDGREDYLITHESFAAIDALTIAMDPAYEQTSVDLREKMEKREADHTTEAEKREQAAREAAEKAEREKVNRERALRVIKSDIDAENALLDRE